MKRPTWLNSADELEAKWRSSSDREVLKAARGVLSDKNYAFFQSAIPFARSASCETEVQFTEELVFKFEQNMGGSDVGGFDPNYTRPPSVDEIARKTQGFSEIVTRLGTAFGRSLTEYSPDTLGYYGTTDIYWDWDPILVTGDPKPFLDFSKGW